MVVLHHAALYIEQVRYFGHPALSPWFGLGRTGVDFFFVLSGFVIFHVHRKDIGMTGRAAAYAWRRFVRVYPPYWVVTAGMIAILLIVPGISFDIPVTGKSIALSLALWPHETGPILDVAWTLQHEVLFYAVFLLALIHRTGVLLLALWIAGSLLANVLVGFDSSAVRFIFSIYNVEFFFGMACAVLFRFVSSRLGLILIVVGIAMLVATGIADLGTPLDEAHDVRWRLLYGSGYALVILGLSGAEVSGRLSVPPFAIFLGTASYAIYLLHTPAIWIIGKSVATIQIDRYFSIPGLFIVIAATATASGVLFHKAVEVPLRTALHGWGSARKSRSTFPHPRRSDVS